VFNRFCAYFIVPETLSLAEQYSAAFQGGQPDALRILSVSAFRDFTVRPLKTIPTEGRPDERELGGVRSANTAS
jgi:hypothetical protein